MMKIQISIISNRRDPIASYEVVGQLSEMNGYPVWLTARRPVTGRNAVVVRRYEVLIHVKEPFTSSASPIPAIDVATIVCSERSVSEICQNIENRVYTNGEEKARQS